MWFCIFKLLSFLEIFMCSLEFYFGLQFYFVFLSYYLFFLSMIIKCYSIAYKYSLQEYNVILLYIMAWIIWCLTYKFFILILLFLILFFYFSPEKVITLSLSLSLSLYIYIYIYYLFFLVQVEESLYFLYNTILGLYDLVACLIF